MSQRITQIAAGLLLLLMPGTLCAQFAGPNVPMVASGQMPSAVPGDEARRSNIFSASFAAGAHYDDNAFGSSKGKRSDIDYYFRPNFAVVQTFRRFDYGLSYSPGIDSNLVRSHLRRRRGPWLLRISPYFSPMCAGRRASRRRSILTNRASTRRWV